jgi:hypothetical protein
METGMSPRQLLLILAIVGAFGVLVPIYKGYDFLDRRLIVAYACLSAVIAAPMATDTFAQQAEDNPLSSLLRAWLYSWAFATGLLAIALFTVNVANWRGRVILPGTSFLVAAECLCLTVAAAVVWLGALLAGRYSATNVRAGFRALFLIVVLSLFLADRYGALSMSTGSMTRLLFMLSSLFGGAALVMHVMLRIGGSHSRDRWGSGGM